MATAVSPLIITIIFLLATFLHFSSSESISRAHFPDGFIFGTASSAYQFEGAATEGNKGASIWDTFTRKPGRILDFSNADVAVDQYHRFQDDIGLMKDLGMDAYRFSISWPRIFPNGTGKLNPEGITYYNKLIDGLLEKGIQPYVTLYHWDLPQMLQDRYGGWLSKKIIEDFEHYANTCFKAFGDRVKNWITFNEPHNFAIQSYDFGIQAPGRCSILGHMFCKEGNSSSEPYIVAHHILLSHAAVYHSYQSHFKVFLASNLIDPYLLFLDPIFFGRYPLSMRKLAGERVPEISSEMAKLIMRSVDFVGLNHYTTSYVRNDRSGFQKLILQDASTDSAVITSSHRNGIAIGEKAASSWLRIVPWGIRKLMNHVKDKYGNPLAIVTENGMDDPNSPFISREKALQDEKRIEYHRDYLSNLSASIREDKCNVGGYFIWSLLDNWEWNSGYTVRFGLYYVDYSHNLTRIPKASGGLGLRSARELNHAYLMKLMWGVLKRPKELWVEVLLTNSGLSWGIRNGRRVNFWKEKWIDSGKVIGEVVTPPSELEHYTVADFCCEEGQWDVRKLSVILPQPLLLEVLGMTPPNRELEEDTPIWGLEPKGGYSVRSGYLLAKGLVPIETNDRWRLIWRWKGPQRVRQFLWLMGNNRLLTNEERCRRHLVTNNECGICPGEPESCLHILRDCLAAKQVWCRCLDITVTDDFFRSNFEDWWSRNLADKSKASRFGITCWILWRNRNDRIFQGKVLNTVGVIKQCNYWIQLAESAYDDLEQLRNNAKPIRQESLISWEAANAPGFTNTDDSVIRSTGQATAGGALRNYEGRVLDAFTVNLGKCSITRAELTGAVIGMERAWALGIRDLTVQLDSLCAVQLLTDMGNLEHQHATIVSRYRSLLHRAWNLKVVHIYREGNCLADSLASRAAAKHKAEVDAGEDLIIEAGEVEEADQRRMSGKSRIGASPPPLSDEGTPLSALIKGSTFSPETSSSFDPTVSPASTSSSPLIHPSSNRLLFIFLR
ncbi:Putative beta-glucosidase 41 [Linum perenne]